MAEGTRLHDIWENRPLKQYTGTLAVLLFLSTFYLTGLVPPLRTTVLVAGGMFLGETFRWLTRTRA